MAGQGQGGAEQDLGAADSGHVLLGRVGAFPLPATGQKNLRTQKKDQNERPHGASPR